jgi:tRNA(Arg) A34 adenosine deaminase TadA
VENEKFMKEAIRLSLETMRKGTGGPFGAVVVRDGEIIARGWNQVSSTNDPTAHAEVVAIREACKVLGTFQLEGCEIYTSCEPCPMCFGAIYWARPAKLYYAATRNDAADAGFDDDFIYREIALAPTERRITTCSICREEAIDAFKEWKTKADKIDY